MLLRGVFMGTNMALENGIKDFRIEQFIYFGDQANMPYGNYSETNKTGFLKELILKSGKQFLEFHSYYKDEKDIYSASIVFQSDD